MNSVDSHKILFKNLKREVVYLPVGQKWREQERIINVGVDVWDFYPVAITKIEALIR